MKQYCIYTRDPQYVTIAQELRDSGVTLDIHLNRIRFCLSSLNARHIVLMLKYSTNIHCIEHERDHVLGR